MECSAQPEPLIRAVNKTKLEVKPGAVRFQAFDLIEIFQVGTGDFTFGINGGFGIPYHWYSEGHSKIKPVVVVCRYIKNVLIHGTPGIQVFFLEFGTSWFYGGCVLVYRNGVGKIEQVCPPGKIQVEGIVAVQIIFDIFKINTIS